jgi:hypothetical protein
VFISLATAPRRSAAATIIGDVDDDRLDDGRGAGSELDSSRHMRADRSSNGPISRRGRSGVARYEFSSDSDQRECRHLLPNQ